MIKSGEYFKVDEKNAYVIEQFIKRHKFIYRYLPMEYLLDSIQNKQMVFINPKKWNDPFDNYLFKLPESENLESFTSNIFCQCITLNPHSQAYWKTYGENGYAARLKISTKDYLDSIKKTNLQFWIGKMYYMRESILIEKLRDIKNLKKCLTSPIVSDEFLTAFFFKRKPFEYEEEIRLLIKSTKTKSGLKKIKVSNSDIIKEIRLDPRMSRSEEIAWKSYLKSFEIKVTKSQLFTNKKIL